MQALFSKFSSISIDWQDPKTRLIAGAAGLWLGTKIFRRVFLSWPKPPPGASIFVTGAGTGIGRSTTLLLNSKGFRVFAGVISEDEGKKLVMDAQHPSSIVPIVCDVTSVESIRNAAGIVAKATGGRLWGVVNNAGVNFADGPVEFVPLDRVRRVFEVNVMGIYIVLQAFLPLIRAVKGRVVNVASVNGFMTWAEHTPYCVSKHGVEALSDGLRLELDPLGVFVSVIEPGGVQTPMWEATINTMRDCGKLMGPACDQVYGVKDIEEVKKRVEFASKQNSDPIVVARAIYDSLTSPTPKMRYTIAKISGILNISKRYLLSDWFFHKLILFGLGKSREPIQQK